MSRRIAAFVAIGVLAVCLAAGALWLFDVGLLTFSDTWAIPVVVILAATGVLVSLVRLFRTYPHGGLSVLWCRRFAAEDDRAGSANRWLERILVEACHEVALPITLRDRSVGLARSIADPLEVLLGVALIFIGLPAFAWLVFTLPDRYLDGWPGLLIVIAGFGSVWALIIAVSNWLLSSLATYRGDPEQLQLKVRTAMAKRRLRSATFVVRCTDHDWQDCVEAVLAEASLVVLDATDKTDNVEWEIRRSLERLGPDCVLFLGETPDDRAVERVIDPAPTTRDSENTPNCIFLHYGTRWVGDERKAFLDSEANRGGSGKLGPRSHAVSAAVRKWLTEPKPDGKS